MGHNTATCRKVPLFDSREWVNRMKIKNLGKTLLLTAAAVVAVAAHASLADATILIDRAANSKTLSVRYDGAKAVLAELRINGKSVASRQLDNSLDSGETNFTIDVAALTDGDNKVEIRLYDGNNKVVGKQESIIAVDRSGVGPVYITSPKSNDTVQGYAEIKVGFKTELKNAYVSFFVNDEFKILKNFPPYNYMWDTTSVPNGWHEVQAWVVDESNATFKTEKMRLFVNNPGGRTKREELDPATVTRPGKPVEAPATELKAPTDVKTSGIADARGVGTSGNLATGPRLMNTDPVKDPKTGNTKAGTTKPIEITNVGTEPANTDLTAVKLNAPKLKPVNLNFGSRVAYEGTFDVYLDGKRVSYDVAPRVLDGVPLSPFRHLFESYGGKVKWNGSEKSVEGKSEGLDIWFRIGDPTALVGGNSVIMEMAPFIERGRSIVPLSFMSDALKIDIHFDPATGHVLILSNRSK